MTGFHIMIVLDVNGLAGRDYWELVSNTFSVLLIYKYNRVVLHNFNLLVPGVH